MSNYLKIILISTTYMRDIITPVLNKYSIFVSILVIQNRIVISIPIINKNLYMRINKLFTAFFFLSLSLSVSAYDAVGHRIVADIAYQNLTKTARTQLDKILGKHGLIYAATWPCLLY